MGFIRRALFWAFIAIIVNGILKLYITLDTNKRQFNHTPGPCRYISGINDGSEDIELLPDGTAIISSGIRPAFKSDELQGVVGKIFMYEFAKTEEEKKKVPSATELKIISKTLDPNAFNPHGMSTFVDSKGVVHIYVINHLPSGDVIERFTFEKEKKTLTHTKSIKDPLIYAANDLVVIGLDKFYLTNDHYFKNQWLLLVEWLSLTALGNVVYYNGKEASVVDQWLLGPNGINVDKTRKQLYLSLVFAKTLRVYDIQRDNNITIKKDIQLNTCIDNLFVDPTTNDIWIGAHPVVYKMLSFINHPKSGKSPSQVLRVRLATKQGEDDYIAEPYSNDGNGLAASTVAVRYNNQILIGTVTTKALLCDIVAPEVI